MSGRFVPVKLVPPPAGKVLQVRGGGSVFSASLSPIPELGWTLHYGGKSEQMPGPPDEWWISDETATKMGIDINAVEARSKAQRRASQVVMDFSACDSATQSGGLP